MQLLPLMKALLLFAALALTSGCSTYTDVAGDWVVYNARTPEFLYCGWRLHHQATMGSDHCWAAIPPASGKRTIALTDDACEASDAVLTGLKPGTIVYEFGPSTEETPHETVEYVAAPCE